ncbi:MAG: glycosyltransferase [Gemmatimonadetes bacterium]|nr:glycosyltransferase [Gemmatimonadota bacterium]
MIYYCIPCHNEERTVGIVLWKIRQVMADFRRDYQILVADDASTDGSWAVLEPYARVLPLTLMSSTTRRGYAATLEMLLREAVRRSDYPKRDAIVVLQADFTDDPEFAGALLRKLESGADVAIGHPRAGGRSGMPYGFARRLARRRKWPAEIKDPIHGFNAFRLLCVRKAVEVRQEKRLLTCEGWAANAELLHAVLPHARRLEVVEIVTHPERLQRASRVAVLSALRESWRFGRGREGRPGIAADGLVPDRVHGDRATLRTDGAAVPVAAAREPAERQDRQSEPAGEGSRARPGARSRARDGARTGRGRGESGQRGHRERDGETRQGGRRRGEETRPSASEDTPDGQSERPASPSEHASPTERKPRRPPRGRRGGRPRDRSATAPVQEETADSPDATDEPDGAAEPDSTPTVAANGEDSPAGSKRRRRGRRGGRKRRSGRGRPGTVDAPEATGEADAPPANGEGPAPEPDSTKEP